ncbi:PIN domain-containing protein [candidate division WWE3 bacterium]|nr:PIN domain-containing protein [candidate division WWE3 bacterium]
MNQEPLIKENSTVYFDSNVIIAYLVKPHPDHKRAKKLYATFCKKQAELILSALTLDEVYYVLLRTYKHSRESIAVLLSTFIVLSAATILPLPSGMVNMLEYLDLMTEIKLDPRDAFHFVIAEKNEVAYLVTFDKAFRKEASSQKSTSVKFIC